MLRQAWQVLFAVTWMIACFIVFFPPMLLWPTRDNRLRMAALFSRYWSRGTLWAGGVRVRVIEGEELLAARPAVFLFNHSSNLDFLINASIAPLGALVFGKYELSRIPLLGWVWWLSGHPMLRRKVRDDWERKLKEVERLLATGRYTTIIAPEGTRNRDGKLLPFKKGPFHLAVGAKVPLIPWVIEGSDALLGARALRSGEITVRVLTPIETTTWTAETLDARIDEVRNVYLAALRQQEAPAPASKDAAA